MAKLSGFIKVYRRTFTGELKSEVLIKMANQLCQDAMDALAIAAELKQNGE